MYELFFNVAASLSGLIVLAGGVVLAGRAVTGRYFAVPNLPTFALALIWLLCLTLFLVRLGQVVPVDRPQ